jgi:hypothetical protein
MSTSLFAYESLTYKSRASTAVFTLVCKKLDGKFVINERAHPIRTNFAVWRHVQNSGDESMLEDDEFVSTDLVEMFEMIVEVDEEVVNWFSSMFR